MAGIVTPVVVGYIVAETGNHGADRYFVGARSIVAALLVLFVMVATKRVGEKQPV